MSPIKRKTVNNALNNLSNNDVKNKICEYAYAYNINYDNVMEEF